MSRPKVPAEIEREVKTEARHQCAVCGYSTAHEMAHIIPWSRCRKHEAANLVLLCANCHTRADRLEKWGAATLRYYKQNPHWKAVEARCTRVTISVRELPKDAERRLKQARLKKHLLLPAKARVLLEWSDGGLNATVQLPDGSMDRHGRPMQPDSPNFQQGVVMAVSDIVEPARRPPGPGTTKYVYIVIAVTAGAVAAYTGTASHFRWWPFNVAAEVPQPPAPPDPSPLLAADHTYLEFGSHKLDANDPNPPLHDEGHWQKLKAQFPELLKRAKARNIPGTDSMQLLRCDVRSRNKDGSWKGDPYHRLLLIPGFADRDDPHIKALQAIAKEMELGFQPSKYGDEGWEFSLRKVIEIFPPRSN